MRSIRQDVRYAFRTFFKYPGFTLVAVLSLALGIGANTSIFSVIHAVVLRPLPYKDPDSLMAFFLDSRFWSYPKFEVLRDQTRSFENVAAVRQQAFALVGKEDAERIEAELVSASYFPLLGINASLGRTFLPQEDQTPGTHPVVLIGQDLWRRHFGSDPKVLGKTITLEKTSLTVVGVLPEDFKGQSGVAEAWIPMMMVPELTFPRRLSNPFGHWHEVIGRLKKNVSPEKARAEMATVASNIDAAFPPPPKIRDENTQIRFTPLRDAYLDPAVRKSLFILLGAVGIVLLIACVNVANLLLARAVSRQKEVAIRLALGASRGRLIRQVLTESVLLALLGGVLGLLFSAWGNEILAALKPVSNPAFRAKDVQMLNFAAARLNMQVVLFNLLLSTATGLLFGSMPAIRASQSELSEALKEGAIAFGRTWRFPRLRIRNFLVVGEIALSLVLLVCAGLMIRSFIRLHNTKFGFDASNVLTLRIDFPRNYNATRFHEQLLDRVSGLPGVRSAAITLATPLSSAASGTILLPDAADEFPSGADLSVGYHIVSPDYFKVFGIPVIKGRAFTNRDRTGSQRVAMISRTAAQRFWPGENPIGRRINIGVGWEPPEDRAEIIGIVGDVKYGKIEEAVRPDVYLCYLQPVEPEPFLVVRAAGDPALLVTPVLQEIRALDKNLPVYNVKTMEERISEAISMTRFSAVVLAAFAGVAALLAAAGIYGVMAYLVARRTRELGIRVALGADRANLFKLVLGEGLVLTVAGISVGVALATAAGKVLSSLLYGVERTDAVTYISVCILLAVVALLATYLPAHRAARIDPMLALRCE